MPADQYVPSGRGPQIIAIYSMFLGLTTIFVALRVYVRAFLIKNIGVDDFTIITAWLLFFAFVVFSIEGVYHGSGQHAWLIKPSSEVPIALKWWWLCEQLYVLSTMTVKLSIAIQLLRVSPQKRHRTAIFTTIFFVQAYSIAFFFVFLFQCYPVKFFWTQLQGDSNGVCLHSKIIINSFYGYSAVCCVGDWILAILPYFLVKDLDLDRRAKFLVSLVLAMAAAASTATIIRLPYIKNMSNKADFLYATIDVAIWSCAETAIGLLASCAATFRPLFRKVLDADTEGSLPLRSRMQEWGRARSNQGYERSISPTEGTIQTDRVQGMA